MKIIAHRGNLYGPNPETENTVEQILKAINEGFEVEVDMWFHGHDRLMLGHDRPTTHIETGIFQMYAPHLWVHWKRESGLLFGLVCLSEARQFMHDMEAKAKVSDGSIWLYPGTPITDEMRKAPAIVACLPELAPDWDLTHATYICTDYPVRYAEKYAASK